MSLNEKSEIVTWPATHYLFLEKVGPFMQTAPQAWQDLHKQMPEIKGQNKVTGALSLYNPEKQIYRAGVSLDKAPEKIPAGFKYEKFAGGKYSRFVVTGSYSQMPQASGRVFELVKENKIQRRDDFCIENYANDPQTTPEKDLITEILIPTA